MNADILIKDVMTDELIVLHPNDTMETVAKLLEEYSIHHLPVINDRSEVIGIISHTDFYKIQDAFTMFNCESALKSNKNLFSSLLVSDVMTKQVAVLYSTDSLILAADLFRKNLFHALPIIDENKKLVGIITTYDLLNIAYQKAF